MILYQDGNKLKKLNGMYSSGKMPLFREKFSTLLDEYAMCFAQVKEGLSLESESAAQAVTFTLWKATRDSMNSLPSGPILDFDFPAEALENFHLFLDVEEKSLKPAYVDLVVAYAADEDVDANSVAYALKHNIDFKDVGFYGISDYKVLADAVVELCKINKMSRPTKARKEKAVQMAADAVGEQVALF